MQGEDIFLGQNDFGKIFILLNSLKKSGFREKRKKNSLRCFSLRRYPLRRYRVYSQPLPSSMLRSPR